MTRPLNANYCNVQWTLLLCVNDTTKLANGAKCPAFALIARCYYGEVDEGDGKAH